MSQKQRVTLSDAPAEPTSSETLAPTIDPIKRLRRRSTHAEPGERFDDFILRRRKEYAEQRSSVSIYTSPLLVVAYFCAYLFYELRGALRYLFARTSLTAIVATLGSLLYLLYQIEGPHTVIITQFETIFKWYGYWVLLGIASSIGLGTGLHTFVLFLGPHIAEVTITAFKCGNLAFAVRGEDRFRCVSVDPSSDSALALATAVTIWNIYKKVGWESFFWGAGTAIGELPPYFVARAAALSGGKNEDIAELDAILAKSPDEISFKERALVFLHRLINRFGFAGILLCAAIPNPLFDLAGITCGHFLVPLSIFFGATFIGKACIKATLQTLIVIVSVSGDTLAIFLNILKEYAPSLHDSTEITIQSQLEKFTKARGMPVESGQPSTSLISLIWNTIIFIMLSYFLLSTIESLAISHMAREHEEKLARLEHKSKGQLFIIKNPNE